MKCALIIGLLAFALAIQTVSGGKFTLLHFNDFHSKIEPSNEYHKSCEGEQLKQGARAACVIWISSVYNGDLLTKAYLIAQSCK